MQQATHSAAPAQPASFYLSSAIYAISTAEKAPEGTGLALCDQAGSILSLVIDALNSKSATLSTQDDVISAVQAAASLIEAAVILADSEENM